MTALDPTSYRLVNPKFLGDKIEDVEEELFLLYTRRASFRPENGGRTDALQSIITSDNRNGSALGLIDQRNDHIELQFTFPKHISPKHTPKQARLSRKTGRGNKKREDEDGKTSVQMETLEITLTQDITGLRSRVGDTGGGVWRGSVLLSQALLAHFHDTSSDHLFDVTRLKECCVLELGAGTGLLGLILGPLVALWTCTDLPEMVPLIKKNHALNRDSTMGGSLGTEALDWNKLYECAFAARKRMFPISSFSSISGDRPITRELESDTEDRDIDLVLAVDCVYNPSLIPPLLTTIDHFSSPNKTIVMVVMELRDDEVVRQFLTQWCMMPAWEVWRIGDDRNQVFLDERFVIWIGLKGSE
ncbi:hypothetical protein FRB91_000416 [Serendipita sp. 411]|nr:hypothetical protein FRB91_000416 [Serendipita sp. 411]